MSIPTVTPFITPAFETQVQANAQLRENNRRLANMLLAPPNIVEPFVIGPGSILPFGSRPVDLPKAERWKCDYCGGSRKHSEESCGGCGGPR